MATSPKPGSKARYAGIGSDAVERATGRAWEAWIETLEREGAKSMTHKEIAAMLQQEFKLPAWWAQMVTVGYEQASGASGGGGEARGLRVHASRTIAAQEAVVRAAWTQDAGGASVQFKAKGARTQVVVDEEGLPDAAAVKQRKAFWKETLDRLQASVGG